MNKLKSSVRRRATGLRAETRRLHSPPHHREVPSGGSRWLEQAGLFWGDGRFPIPAYSEFMPGPYVMLKPYDEPGFFDVSAENDTVWHISEYQEACQLRPGLEFIGRHLLGQLRKLGEGKHAFSKALLKDNPYWPETLAARAGSLKHERYAVLLPLALSRTLDDKGRIRWTLFGSSEQGPARAFWQSFRSSPLRELSRRAGLALLKDLLARIYGLPARRLADLRRAGFRILPTDRDPDFPAWGEEPLPSWAGEFLLSEKGSLGGVRYLLTFRPFARLPLPVQKAYCAGELHLLPFPGSLIFFGHAGYRRLARDLPLAMQIPLLLRFPGDHSAAVGMRIPQSGWLDEPRAHEAEPVTYLHGPIVSRIKRSHRWNRSRRDENEFAAILYEDRVADVLFSTHPEHLGLYGKPMARNAQIWTHDYRLILDGPAHGRTRIDEAYRALTEGGHFGYRFLFPPMRVGRYEVYWHRPLVAFFPPGADEPTVLLDGPLGYLTAYTDDGGPAKAAAPIELWPRLDRRAPHVDAVELFNHEPGHPRYTTAYNIRKLLEAHELLGKKPLRRSFARQLLTLPKETTLDQWLDSLSERATDPARGRHLTRSLRQRVRRADPPPDADPKTRLPRALTFDQTALRPFEERYWKTIAWLANGRYMHKNNADLAGPSSDSHAARDLEALGNYLHEYYRDLIAHHGMTRRALVGNHWFRWVTDFDFPWSEGWSRNQTGLARERNILVIIPGQDRRTAVVMGDHYDTAYMEDVYENKHDRRFTRAAAAGADDNHSATAALMLAADVLLPLSRAGRLRHDVWLVHLTGEEFPADCLGARNLVQRLVERNLRIDVEGMGWVDLSSVRVRGAYILDMVAHNNDHARYVFQIAPGEGAHAMRLAYHAHCANERWNQSAPLWNNQPARKKTGPYQRVEHETEIPRIAAHPHMSGEIRPSWHFTSSLYNTDAQIFSDAGVPVVLFMECYDINRKGYHDTQDAMKNIDLDYGSALVSIAIETVAQVATSDML